MWEGGERKNEVWRGLRVGGERVEEVRGIRL